MPDPDHFHANLQRGSLLLNHGRPREALSFLQAAIAANPDAPQGYAELARCWNALPTDHSKSIAAINRAIALAPESSFYMGCKGWYLVCLMDYPAALRAAVEGLSLNPACPQSLNTMANVYTKVRQWKQAEATCRRILELDPYDASGLNLLAQALRHQGRWRESRETVMRLLADMPNSAFGHANAGFAALEAGDHLRADEHFLESLRMDPQLNLARRGLQQSLRARIWLTRFNRRAFAFLRRPASLTNMALFVFALMAAMGLGILSIALFPDIGGPIVGLLFAGLIIYVFLSALMGILGHFMLLFHPLVRHSLTLQEKMGACVPAAAFLVAIVWLVASHLAVVALGLFLILAFLALTIQLPLIRDRWLRRQLERSDN